MSGVLPQNHEERVFTIYAIIVSTAYFVYMFTSLMTMITSKRRQSSRMNERLMSIMSYMRNKNFPRNLFRKVYRYYHHYYERKTAFDEAQILGELSEKLRGEVSSFMAFTTFSSAELFHKYDVKYLTLILLITKPVRVQHGENIIEAGQLGVEMYLITSGVLSATYKLFRSKARKLVQGDTIGELCALVRIDVGVTLFLLSLSLSLSLSSHTHTHTYPIGTCGETTRNSHSKRNIRTTLNQQI